MGGAKRTMEDQEAKLFEAASIAWRADVLAAREDHDVMIEGGEQILAAFELDKAEHSEGEYHNVFDSQDEMTECLRLAAAFHGADECGLCVKRDA